MLQSRIQRPIPERLSHYTNLEALKSILSDPEGKGICFRAFSNKCKNDDLETKMGEYMLNRVREVIPCASILDRFHGYDNSASISFMEGDVNEHMLVKYDPYRLEFDLRTLGVGFLAGGLVDCEYEPISQLEEYANEYCKMISSTFSSIHDLQIKYGKFSQQALNKVVSFIMMENDIMQKVFCLKEEHWSEEREWRLVFELKPDDPNIRYQNKKPYIEHYLDKKLLTGITVFCSEDNKDQAQKDADDIKKYISERGYHADVRVEAFAPWSKRDAKE